MVERPRRAHLVPGDRRRARGRPARRSRSSPPRCGTGCSCPSCCPTWTGCSTSTCDTWSWTTSAPLWATDLVEPLPRRGDQRLRAPLPAPARRAGAGGPEATSTAACCCSTSTRCARDGAATPCARSPASAAPSSSGPTRTRSTSCSAAGGCALHPRWNVMNSAAWPSPGRTRRFAPEAVAEARSRPGHPPLRGPGREQAVALPVRPAHGEAYASTGATRRGRACGARASRRQRGAAAARRAPRRAAHALTAIRPV